MGNFFSALVSRHRTLMNVFDKAPVVDKDAFVAPSASVIGDVQIGRGSSIWYGCVLRGKVCLTRSFIHYVIHLIFCLLLEMVLISNIVYHFHSLNCNQYVKKLSC